MTLWKGTWERKGVSVFCSVKWANTHAARNKGMVRLYLGGGPLFLKGCPRLTDVSLVAWGLGSWWPGVWGAVHKPGGGQGWLLVCFPQIG